MQPYFCLLLLDEIRSIRKVGPLMSELITAFEIPTDAPTDYTQFTQRATFKGLRLGVPRDRFFDLARIDHQEIIDATNTAILKMKSLGAVIEDPADLPSVWALADFTSELTVLRKFSYNKSSFRNRVQSRLAKVPRRLKFKCCPQLGRFNQFQ